LAKKLPGLADEIPPTVAAETRISHALTSLLRERGIVAEVQVQDPSQFAFTAQRVPEAPAPAIVFRILSPEIVVDKVMISGAPDQLADKLQDGLHGREGREYSSRQDWQLKMTVGQLLETNGYLDSTSQVAIDEPKRIGDHYAVDVLIDIHAGKQYHIASITADGGPLLSGRDLSQFFSGNPGDLAGPNPLGRLSGQLRGLYWEHGYADVSIDAPPLLDRERSVVAYQLHVVPGPLYRLGGLTIRNLSADQIERVKQMLGMSIGDVFNQNLLDGLYGKVTSEPSLAQYSFSFSPSRHPATNTVDLVLDFYKKSDKATVRVD